MRPNAHRPVRDSWRCAHVCFVHTGLISWYRWWLILDTDWDKRVFSKKLIYSRVFLWRIYNITQWEDYPFAGKSFCADIDICIVPETISLGYLFQRKRERERIFTALRVSQMVRKVVKKVERTDPLSLSDCDSRWIRFKFRRKYRLLLPARAYGLKEKFYCASTGTNLIIYFSFFLFCFFQAKVLRWKKKNKKFKRGMNIFDSQTNRIQTKRLSPVTCARKSHGIAGLQATKQLIPGCTYIYVYIRTRQ